MIDKSLLELLICPKDQSPLKQIDDALICETCKLSYPIKNGIPLLLAEEAKSLD